MDLAKWLADQPHGALSRLKRATGLAYNTVHAICTGKRPPTYDSALAISNATDGAVTVAEVYEISKRAATKPKRKRAALKRRVTRMVKRRRKLLSKSKKAAA